MYYNYYGFNKKPFEIIPDPEMVFMREAHQEAMATLLYGQMYNKSFLLLTGDIGTGKTTLLQVLLRTVYNNDHVCMINHPTFSVDDFYYYMASKFGLPEYRNNKAKFLIEFAEFLGQCKNSNSRVLLIIDEAHLLSMDLLEEIRLLSNHDSEYNVLSIFLVGQPELNDLLSHTKLQSLRQRLGVRFHLTPFSEEETKGYISYRLVKAGTEHLSLFDDMAIKKIHAVTGGTPRLINVVCDQALVYGFAEGKKTINSVIVDESTVDLQIPGMESL